MQVSTDLRSAGINWTGINKAHQCQGIRHVAQTTKTIGIQHTQNDKASQQIFGELSRAVLSRDEMSYFDGNLNVENSYSKKGIYSQQILAPSKVSINI